MDHVAAEPEQTIEAGYPNLIDRALACIDEHRGAIDENALIGFVFGNTSQPNMWRPLLRSVLSEHPDVTLRPDGMWTTGQIVDDSALPTEFVVIDVETTGLKPSQQRIVEVGMIRVSPHGSPLRWSSLVNPGRKMPAYVATLTGIDDSMLAGAPDFRSIAPTIVEIADDLPIVGHNVEFDLAFLNAELVRCGLPKLINTPVDTLSLAHTLVGEARHLNLGDVARVLGVTSKQAHRALADADTTLEVFTLLLARARERGLSTMEDLLRVNQLRRPSAPHRKPVGRGRAVLDRSHLASIPHAPGVYIMRDPEDRVLYVGKAKNLRKRVASYYSQPLGYTRKMDGLLETLSKIDVEVVGTELEALILESQLIRRYRPRFNTVQRNAEQYVYVKVDISNAWPRVTMTRDRSTDGAEYFGPFKSSLRAREAVDLVNDILPLRTCRRSFQDKRSYGSPCLELSLKRCLGPCMGQADSEQYRGLVRDVIAFFHGDTIRMVSHLHTKLEGTIETLDFERAARLRDQIIRVESLARQQQQLDDVARQPHALLVLPGVSSSAREVWYLLNGRRWAQLTVHDSDHVTHLASRLAPITARASFAQSTFVSDHHAVDEMSILGRWMRKTPLHPALIPIFDTSNLLGVSESVLTVDLTLPFGEVPAEMDSFEQTEADDSEYAFPVE